MDWLELTKSMLIGLGVVATVFLVIVLNKTGTLKTLMTAVNRRSPQQSSSHLDHLEILMTVKEEIGGIKVNLERMEKVGEQTLRQATMTNGRVTSLEKTSEMLARVSSENAGLIKALQDDVIKIQK